jgi:hypothetical protein
MEDIPSHCSMIAGTMTSISLVVDGKLLLNLGWCGVGCDGGCRKLWLTKDFNVREMSRTMKEAVLEKVDVEIDGLVVANGRWKVVVEVLKCTKGGGDSRMKLYPRRSVQWKNSVLSVSRC